MVTDTDVIIYNAPLFEKIQYKSVGKKELTTLEKEDFPSFYTESVLIDEGYFEHVRGIMKLFEGYNSWNTNALAELSAQNKVYEKRRIELKECFAGSNLEGLIKEEFKQGEKAIKEVMARSAPMISVYTNLIKSVSRGHINKRHFKQFLKHHYKRIKSELNDEKALENLDMVYNVLSNAREPQEGLSDWIEEELSNNLKAWVEEVIDCNTYNLDEPKLPKFKKKRGGFIKYALLGLTFGTLLTNYFIGTVKGATLKKYFVIKKYDEDGDGVNDKITVFVHETSNPDEICDLSDDEMTPYYKIHGEDTDGDPSNLETWEMPSDGGKGPYRYVEMQENKNGTYDIILGNIGGNGENFTIHDQERLSTGEILCLLHPDSCLTKVKGDYFDFESGFGPPTSTPCGDVFGESDYDKCKCYGEDCVDEGNGNSLESDIEEGIARVAIPAAGIAAAALAARNGIKSRRRGKVLDHEGIDYDKVREKIKAKKKKKKSKKKRGSEPTLNNWKG